MLTAHQHRGIVRGPLCITEEDYVHCIDLHHVSEKADHFYFEDYFDKCGPIFIIFYFYFYYYYLR